MFWYFIFFGLQPKGHKEISTKSPACPFLVSGEYRKRVWRIEDYLNQMTLKAFMESYWFKKGQRSEFCGDCSWAQGAQCKLGWIIQFSVFNGCNKFDKIVWIGLKFDQTLTLIIALECSQAINAWKSMPHQSKLFCNAGFELLYSYCTPEVQTPKTTKHQKFVQMKSF